MVALGASYATHCGQLIMCDCSSTGPTNSAKVAAGETISMLSSGSAALSCVLGIEWLPDECIGEDGEWADAYKSLGKA